MEELLNELREGIAEFEEVKHKWPNMKTQDVIDLLRRFEQKLITATEVA